MDSTAVILKNKNGRESPLVRKTEVFYFDFLSTELLNVPLVLNILFTLAFDLLRLLSTILNLLLTTV